MADTGVVAGAPALTELFGPDKGLSAHDPHTATQATPAAEHKAEDLGVDLSQIEGTGSGGRITVKDVREAAKQA